VNELTGARSGFGDSRRARSAVASDTQWFDQQGFLVNVVEEEPGVYRVDGPGPPVPTYSGPDCAYRKPIPQRPMMSGGLQLELARFGGQVC
jgi:hypothetical protein